MQDSTLLLRSLKMSSDGEGIMTISLDAAAQAMREAMRETVRQHSLWYLIQSTLMILAGILAQSIQ